MQRELGYSIAEIFLDDEQTYGIETSQVGIYTIQVALADTMRHFGAEPGVLAPHSMGRRRPAYISGRAFAGGRHSRHLPAFAPDGRGEATLQGDDIRLMALVEYSAEDITSVPVDYPTRRSASMRHRRTP